MYNGVMDSAINNLNSVNADLELLKRKNTQGDNVQQFQQALGSDQSALLNTMQTENPAMYEYMMKQKMVQNNMQQPSMVEKLRGMFGGN